MRLSGRWKRSKAAWQTCNIRISQVVTGMLFVQPVSGGGGGWDETLSNIWEGVWNAMQAWQWFGAALQPWSCGKNQRAWVEWYVLTHGIVAWGSMQSYQRALGRMLKGHTLQHLGRGLQCNP